MSSSTLALPSFRFIDLTIPISPANWLASISTLYPTLMLVVYTGDSLVASSMCSPASNTAVDSDASTLSPSPLAYRYSSMLIGIGDAPFPDDPTNPRTPGVLRIAYHTSRSIIILINT
jgi:hypothetical protein